MVAKQAARIAAKIAKLETRLARVRRGATDCGKCSGRGRLGGYEHIANGVCFTCGGSGRRRMPARVRTLAADLEALKAKHAALCMRWHARLDEINKILVEHDPEYADEGGFCLFTPEHDEARPLVELELGPEPAELD